MHLVRVPKENENMADATVGAWLVEVGREVEADTPVASLITDKAEFELEAGAAGTILAQAVPVKSTVPVGTVLAAIGGPGEELPDIDALNRELLPARKKKRTAGAPRYGAPNVRATPAARRMAREAGVDLAEIAESAGGPVREKDVVAFLQERGNGPGAAPPPGLSPRSAFTRTVGTRARPSVGNPPPARVAVLLYGRF